VDTSFLSLLRSYVASIYYLSPVLDLSSTDICMRER
jgi:hypothetical protein